MTFLAINLAVLKFDASHIYLISCLVKASAPAKGTNELSVSPCVAPSIASSPNAAIDLCTNSCDELQYYIATLWWAEEFSGNVQRSTPGWEGW